MNIDHIQDATRLNVAPARPDLRRDIYVFAEYARDRHVKRAHRTNLLSKSDSKRLAKLLSDPGAEDEVKEEDCSAWINFVDEFARQLGLVEYDAEGVYAGDSSVEPCYPDNYIEFKQHAYDKLSSMSLADQERHLLDTLLRDNQGQHSEFYRAYCSGRLDGFSTFGSAVGVVPTLDFAQSRRLLLKLLADCPTGKWLSVASFVKYLKKDHRYFLIPKKTKFTDRWTRQQGRYGNFGESKERWGRQTKIHDTDEDGFERVEGRYVERFLENIPHLLGYVDVAYAQTLPQGLYPSLGYLQAFRVSPRLRRALAGEIDEPVVKVTPSFEVYVQSEVYPARVIHSLLPISDLVANDASTVCRLQRQKVAAACAENGKLDVVQLLESLSRDPLPANVRRELVGWSAHSEKFVLYDDCALLESDSPASGIARFCVEHIAQGVDIVRSSAKLYAELEKQQLAPLRVKHGDRSITCVPKKARSAFPRQVAKKREPKTKVTLMRMTRVELLCPDRTFLKRLQNLLAAENCPVEADRIRLSLAYSSRYDKEVNRALRTLKKEYQVKIDDQ